MAPLYILAAAASVVKAAFNDHAQQPLQDSQADLVFPLTLDPDMRIAYPSMPETIKTTEYMGLHPQSTIIINVPDDPSSGVTYSVKSDPPRSQDWLGMPSRLAWNLKTTDIGIRKGGMVGIPAESVRFTIWTPYITIPSGIFDVLLQATHTSEEEQFVVDCEHRDIFPDLVFGLDTPDEDEEAERDELVIMPERYIFEHQNGTCVLLVRSIQAGDTVELGWAAVRGRKLVVHPTGGRVGFAE